MAERSCWDCYHHKAGGANPFGICYLIPKKPWEIDCGQTADEGCSNYAHRDPLPKEKPHPRPRG